MTNAQKVERDEAIAQLREWIKPGDTVYTILDHVSSSGMSRAIRVLVPTINGVQVKSAASGGKPTDYIRKDSVSVDFLHPNWAVGKALGLRHWKRNGREQDALVIGGCGMDMGFHLVYELSSVLYGGRLTPDIYADSATHDQPGGLLLTRDGAPTGYVYLGGYRCLGKGECPSNDHSNHRDRIRCEGFCWQPDGFSRYKPSDDHPRKQIDVGDGQTIDGPYLACVHYETRDEIPVGAKDLIMREDGSALQVCTLCKGEGYLPNPEGPERFDLIHTDGYAIRHRWL